MFWNYKDLTGERFGTLQIKRRDGSGRNGRSLWCAECEECGKSATYSIPRLKARSSKGCACGGVPSKLQVGEKYGSLEVLYRTKELSADGRHLKWRVKCLECGNEKLMSSSSIRTSKSCGCIRAISIKPGHISGRLRAVKFIGRGIGGHYFWLCKCQCGKESTVSEPALYHGYTKSCGCIRKKHGMSGTKIYRIWSSMRGRCSNPKHSSYSNYGGRGVQVCKRWEDFESFLFDMGENPKGKSLDRIDNDGNYEPENCRWATAKEQANNRNRKLAILLECFWDSGRGLTEVYRGAYKSIRDVKRFLKGATVYLHGEECPNWDYTNPDMKFFKIIQAG